MIEFLDIFEPIFLSYHRTRSCVLISLSSDISRSDLIERIFRTSVKTACKMKSSSSDRSSQFLINKLLF